MAAPSHRSTSTPPARNQAEHPEPTAVLPAAVAVKAACAYTGLSRSTLWSLTVSGEIPSVSVGRARSYLIADLDRFLAGRRSTGEAV